MTNYLAIQGRIANLITNELGGIACTITAMDGGTLNTVVAFGNALFQNIDNRQNPTQIIGVQGQLAYIPGNIAWLPDAAVTISWVTRVNGSNVTTIKTIKAVTACQPALVPLYYILQLE